jgi:LacI family transcriptional regulator
MNLKELSQSLGLSQTTVSRALNGYPEVAEATRQRVMQAARQHNYRPNTRARGLATGRAMAVGHVIPLSTHHEMVNPIFADFVAGASEIYSQNGYDMVISAVPDEAEEDAYRTLVSKGSVDGVIVHGPRQGDSRIGLLRQLGLPFVVHGRDSEETQPYNWVDVNNRVAFEGAAAHLIGLGHRRIALINGLLHMDFAARRLQGYLDALATSGIACDDALIHSAEMTEAEGYSAATAMLEQPDPPTAFLGASIITCFGIRRAIEGKGLALGRDVSVIAFDDDLSYLRDETAEPMFTATKSSVREAGRICAQRLLDIITESDESGPTPVR